MLIRFKIEHLEKMKASQLIGMDLTAYSHTEGPAYTWIKDDKIIGSGGIQRLWDGVGEAWLIIGDRALEHPVLTGLKSIRMFKAMVEGFHRIQAHVLDGFEKGVQFATAVGFEHESLMRQYGPNKEDYHRYVILR